MRIGIYGRKSNYSDKSDSVKLQIKTGAEYAEKNYESPEIIVYDKDDGYSGATTDRPDFKRLMKDVESDRLDVLICYKIDRISRNIRDFANVFKILEDHHVQFVSVKEQIDTSTPLGRAMMYICSIFAQMERETTTERIRDSCAELAKMGCWPGGRPPIGYKREKITVGNKKHTILVENPEELPYLNKICDTFLQGYSLQQLERHFRYTGFRSLNGKYLCASQLYQTLTNPDVIPACQESYEYFEKLGCRMERSKEEYTGEYGLLVYGRTAGSRYSAHINNPPEKWMVTVGKHKPIMSFEKWKSIQDKFGLNKIDKTRKHEIGILNGSLKCKCGYTMRTKHKVDHVYNKVYDSYFCPLRDRRGLDYCDTKMVSIAQIDESFMEILSGIALDKSKIEMYMKKADPPMPARNIEEIKKDLTSANKKIKALTDAIEEGPTSTAVKYLIAEIEKLDKQAAGLQSEIREFEQAERDRKSEEKSIDIIYDEICYYVKNHEQLTYEEKNNYVKKILKKCVWDGASLFVTF